MTRKGKFTFTNLLPKPFRIGGRQGKPQASDRTVAEQTREIAENEQARGSVPSQRERMVDIGRGGQQAGRQGE